MLPAWQNVSDPGITCEAPYGSYLQYTDDDSLKMNPVLGPQDQNKNIETIQEANVLYSSSEARRKPSWR